MLPDGSPTKVGKVTEDCFAALVRLFMRSSKWTTSPPIGYSDSTKDVWSRELNRMARPDCLGALSLQEIRPSLVQGYFDGIAHLPGKQDAGLSALKQLEKWSIVRELLPRQITLGVEISKSDDDGHIPWPDDLVALGERAARADYARAITLAANTGQRGSDLIRMGPTDIEVFQGVTGINVTQQKTGKQVWVPVTDELGKAMGAWDRRPGPYLLKVDGTPWTRKQLSNNWGYHRDTAPALAPIRAAGLVMHGLRGTACVRLRRAGATIPQIADMVGMSEDMVARYCRFSVQKENALAAVLHLNRTFGERELDKSEKSKR